LKIVPTCFGSQGIHHQGALYGAWLKFVHLHVCTVHQWLLKHFIIQQMHKYIIR